MSNRAAIIITDFGRIRVTDDTQSWSDVRYVNTSPELLEDLLDIVDHILDQADPEYWTDVRNAAKRVLELLP
jgi:hypothetical protein